MRTDLSPVSFLYKFISEIKSICGETPEQKLIAQIFIRAIEDSIQSAYLYKSIINLFRFKRFLCKYWINEQNLFALYLLFKTKQRFLREKYPNIEKSNAVTWMNKRSKGFIYWCEASGIDSEWFLQRINYLTRIKTIFFKKISEKEKIYAKNRQKKIR